MEDQDRSHSQQNGNNRDDERRAKNRFAVVWLGKRHLQTSICCEVSLLWPPVRVMARRGRLDQSVPERGKHWTGKYISQPLLPIRGSTYVLPFETCVYSA